MEFIKIRNVKSPIRDANENAGIDVFIPEYLPDFIEAFNAKNKDRGVTLDHGLITIPPHHAALIPSGLMSKFPKDVALIACNKSGVATKKQLVYGAELIDTGYQGEWHLHLINTSDETQTLECGTKALQFVPVKIDVSDVVVTEATPEEFYTEKTNRGAGGFGSTGIK